MSVINPANTLEFVSTDSLFARVRKRLRSYDAVGILDEGDWYYYIKEVLDRLGVAVYQESEAVLFVKNFKAPLPENFSTLYAAYKCTPTVLESKNQIFPQTGFVFYIEETHEPYKKCGTGWYATKEVVDGDKITIRSYIEGQPTLISFSSPLLLRLSANAKGICDGKCENLFARTPHEITIDKGFVYANFDNDSIYMKYFGFPLDKETGLPLIPSNSYIEKAIEDYIVYRIFEDFLFNGDVPDIQNKYQLARANSDDSMKSALYLTKHPSFQTTINYIRQQRKNLSIYQQQIRK
jgi:hypothetical protein